MNKTMYIRYIWVVVPLLLSASACNLPKPTATSTAAPPSVVAPPIDTATAQFQGVIPINLPGTRMDHTGDVDSSVNAARKQVTSGDVFVQGLYERPFNANTMDKYFPYLDIVDTQGFKDDTWGYATITLVDKDSNGGLPGEYALEIDLDRDGRGDWLIRATNPASTQWSTQGVQAYKNANGDIGGVAVMTADNKPRGGDGYETLVFDQGKGSLTDGAWVRIAPNDPKTVQIAFKLSMLGSPTSYAMGAWAGTNVDPAMFDYNDHMTHAQAGSPNPGYEVYPLKKMAEIDNTCRLAVGFTPTGKEPGLCLTVQRQVEGESAAPCVPHPQHCPLSLMCEPVSCP
jgi:hypothetical protein